MENKKLTKSAIVILFLLMFFPYSKVYAQSSIVHPNLPSSPSEYRGKDPDNPFQINKNTAQPRWEPIDSAEDIYIDKNSIKKRINPYLKESVSASFVYGKGTSRKSETYGYDCNLWAKLNSTGEIEGFNLPNKDKDFTKSIFPEEYLYYHQINKKIFDVLCPQANSPWIKFDDGFYVHRLASFRHTLKANGTIIYEYLMAQEDEENIRKYFLLAYQFNCDKKQMRGAPFNYYSLKFYPREYNWSNWEYVLPKSGEESILNFYCNVSKKLF